MKICVIGTRGFPFIQGGVEKHCEMLYPQLKNAEIIVFRRKPYVTESLAYQNIRFVDLPSTKIKGFEAVLHSFLASLRAIRIRPDAVHFHNIGPALFSPLIKLFKIPVVLTYHSPNYEHKKWGKLAKTILRFSEQIALKYADKIIFVSKFQQAKYPEWVLAKSAFVPNGIDEPVISGKQDHLEAYGLTPGKYILSVGRITPEKGFHTLVQAFRASEPEDVKLVIAGSMDHKSAYMEQLKALAGELPVVFPGYVFGEKLAQLYANAGLFVLASENEGFPLVLLEAMSYGRDVLVSDIPATHLVELPEQDYFPVGDHETLGKKLKERACAPSEKTYDLTAFSWEKIGKQTMELLEEACRECVKV